MEYKNAVELCADFGGNFASFGRAVYKGTDCGPWCNLILTGGRSMSYEVKGAEDPSCLVDADIIGVEVGSIVEGSDAEVGPEFLKFPFTSEEFWGTVEDISNQVSFYWDRDNTRDYIIEKGDKEYYFNDYEMSGLPKKLESLFEKWDREDGYLDEDGSIELAEGITLTRINKSDFID